LGKYTKKGSAVAGLATALQGLGGYGLKLSYNEKAIRFFYYNKFIITYLSTYMI